MLGFLQLLHAIHFFLNKALYITIVYLQAKEFNLFSIFQLTYSTNITLILYLFVKFTLKFNFYYSFFTVELKPTPDNCFPLGSIVFTAPKTSRTFLCLVNSGSKFSLWKLLLYLIVKIFVLIIR